ncbi:MAG: serine hydrolase [Lewinella sp.]|nr:serine hydrolase [Lewinella sp.]
MKHILFTLLTILWFPFSIACQIDFSHYRPGPQDDPAFLRADSAIRADAYGEVHSLLVVEKGKLVFERYYRDWTPDSLHQLQSATKSIVATLLGCALQQGLIPGVDQPISAYYPYIEGRDTLKNGIRIRDLLTQRHGLKWKEAPWDDPGNTWRKVLATEGNWFETILKTPMDTAPGARFNYSNAAPVLTTGIIQAASGMRIDSFADRYLFKPLEIDHTFFWQGNGGPQNNGMALLFMTARDMAKIGQLYLQGGKWGSRQVMPSWFAQEAVSPKVHDVEGNGYYAGYDYGYFWWSNPVLRTSPDGRPAKVFLARGAGGQNIIVWPEREMVVVITAWNLQQSNRPQVIFDDYMLTGNG